MNEKYLSLKPFVHKKLSYAYGRSSKELRNITVNELINEMVLKEPNSIAVAVYDEDIKKTFKELDNDINKLVNGLVYKLNVKRGDKVAIYSYNNYQYLLIQFACHKLGLIVNPFNPSYKVDEFSYVLSKSDANILFIPGKKSKQTKLNNHWSIICDNKLKKLQIENKIKNLKNIIIIDGYDEDDKINNFENELNLNNIKVFKWIELLSENMMNLNDDQFILTKLNQVESDDIYGVYYTSGTTGVPKGATITQFTVINNAKLTIDRLCIERGPLFNSIKSNICLPLPLFHEFAGVLGILSPFFYGGSFVLTGIKYNIQSIFRSIIKFNCNTLFCSPTILIDLINFIKDNQLDLKNFNLKLIIIGGSPVMPELINKAYKIFSTLDEIRIGYGSTENGVVATFQTTNELPEKRLNTVGSPLDFTEIRIIDTTSGLLTKLNEPGEIQTRGFNTMISYYNDIEATKSAITQTNWYKTGDIGSIDQFGSLNISGRIKDLIIKGGENIYPAEIESVLHTHEAIDDAHVIGVPNERYGEEICTWIKLNNKFKLYNNNSNDDKLKTDIIDYCRKKMAHNKVPKYILFVDEFPLTPIKKVKKFEMRAQSIKMLNLD